MSQVARQRALQTYVVGFILSLLLTLTAYIAVNDHMLNRRNLILFIVGLALVQLWVQLLFFLHLGSRPAQRWNLMVFLFAGLVVLILVFGSLWIMYNLNYHHEDLMTPTDTQIINDEGITR